MEPYGDVVSAGGDGGQAAERPNAVALVDGDEQVSYGELNERANRLAGYLRARGVGAGTPVGLCVDRSPRMVTAILAVL